jgi:hypothetical protein
VHKRMMQVAIMFGVLSIPTFVSADGGLLGNTLNKSSEIVEAVTNKMTDIASEVEQTYPLVSEPEKMSQSVTKIVETVNETAKKVTEAVEVNVSPSPYIKVNTGIVEAEVSESPKVKVDTSIAKAEIDDSVKVDIQVRNDIKPHLTVQTPKVNVETSVPEQSTPEIDEPQTTKAEVEIEPDFVQKQEPSVEKDKPDSSEQPEFVGTWEQLALAESTTIPSNSISAQVENIARNIPSSGLPLIPTGEYDQMKVMLPFQSGPSTPTNTVATGGVMPVADLNGMELSMENRNLIYSAKTRLFFDQWLNAPPSQPPQHSFFTISSI